MSKVLILDANHRTALAITRSLGAKGVAVVVADETSKTLAAASKYGQESFTYPSPYTAPERFIAHLDRESRHRGIDIIIPATDVSASVLLEHRERLHHVQILGGDLAAFQQLTNKISLLRLARELHINIPDTHVINDAHDLQEVYPKLQFPLVMKPYQSRILSQGRWMKALVHYCTSIQDVETTVAKYAYFNQHPFLLQEYIEGQGHGLFALYDQARPVAFFAHKRLREKPPTGGVSVLSESIPLEPSMYQMGKRILDHVQWHGVAMIEFKVAPDGTPYLMEVNARFWGSLQLAIDAGVDFPWLLYQLAEGKTPDEISSYEVGVRNRWLLGDALSLCTLFARPAAGPCISARTKWHSLLQFLHFFQSNTRYDTNRWHDLSPFFFELQQYLRRKVRRVMLQK